jgi:hypothetical protein
VVSTPSGRKVIDAVPEKATGPPEARIFSLLKLAAPEKVTAPPAAKVKVAAVEKGAVPENTTLPEGSRTLSLRR